MQTSPGLMPHLCLVSGCSAPGIGPVLRHFHTKNDPLAVLSPVSVQACSTDPTCSTSVAKSYYCRAGSGITNYLPIRERLFHFSLHCDSKLDCHVVSSHSSYEKLEAIVYQKHPQAWVPAAGSVLSVSSEVEDVASKGQW